MNEYVENMKKYVVLGTKRPKHCISSYFELRIVVGQNYVRKPGREIQIFLSPKASGNMKKKILNVIDTFSKLPLYIGSGTWKFLSKSRQLKHVSCP